MESNHRVREPDSNLQIRRFWAQIAVPNRPQIHPISCCFGDKPFCR